MLRTRQCLGESGKMKVLVTTEAFGTRKPNYLAGWDGCGCLYVKSNGWWKILAVLKKTQTKQKYCEQGCDTCVNRNNLKHWMQANRGTWWYIVTYQLEEPREPLPYSTGTMTKKKKTIIENTTVDNFSEHSISYTLQCQSRLLTCVSSFCANWLIEF